jgi:YD repeat-containing protein
VTTEHLAEGIAADYDTEGRLVSIKAASDMHRYALVGDRES